MYLSYVTHQAVVSFIVIALSRCELGLLRPPLSTVLQVGLEVKPLSLLNKALQKKELKHVMSRLHATKLVLKVVGREEYLLKDEPLIHYKVQREG